MEDTYNYYYLLYKLRRNPKLWIIEESQDKILLIDRVKKINSKDEIYFIYRKIYTKTELETILNSKFKRFQNFKLDYTCKLIFQTE